MELDFLRNPPLVWFLIGLVFAFLELIVPGLVLLFFGIGAWITSVFCLVFDVETGFQILVFSITTIVSLVILRKYFKKTFFQEKKNGEETLEDEFIGKTAIAETNISPGIEGKITLKGTIWTAKSSEPIIKGQRIEIVDKESITLIVKPIKTN